jgi:hypothetical protein
VKVHEPVRPVTEGPRPRLSTATKSNYAAGIRDLCAVLIPEDEWSAQQIGTVPVRRDRHLARSVCQRLRARFCRAQGLVPWWFACKRNVGGQASRRRGGAVRLALRTAATSLPHIAFVGRDPVERILRPIIPLPCSLQVEPESNRVLHEPVGRSGKAPGDTAATQRDADERLESEAERPSERWQRGDDSSGEDSPELPSGRMRRERTRLGLAASRLTR